MDLDDRWILYLHEAVQGGSVRAAADKLNLNPSAISRQISQLESSIGASLMERHSRGVRATEAGELVLEYFRRRRADEQDVVSRVEELKGLKRGHINIAMGEGFVGSIPAGPFSRFWTSYPYISMNIEVASTNDVVRLLLEDAVHIGLVYNPPREARLRSHSIARQPIRVIARADHPLAGLGRPVELGELADQRIAQLQQSFGIRQIIDAMLELAGVSIPWMVTTGSIAVLKAYVEHGGGLTLLPAFVVAQEIQDGRFVALPLSNQLLDASVHVMTRLGRELPMAAATILRQISREFRRLEVADS